MKTKTTLSLTIAVAMAAASASAAVVVNDTATFTTAPDNTGGSGTSFTITSSDLTSPDGFDASSSDKLILTFGSEYLTNTVSSITYGGTSIEFAMTSALLAGDNNRGMFTYYLDNPAAGDLVVTFSGSTNGIGGSLFAVSGTKDGTAGIGATDNTGAALTTTANGSLLIAAGIRNDNTTTTSGLTISAPYTGVFDQPVGSSVGGSGYYVAGASGEEVSYSFTPGADFSGSVEFVAVPEPSSFALLAGMFGLTWVMLRRRS